MFNDTVCQILATKRENLNADTSTLYAKIDQLLYHLYGLPEEEIRMEEESVGG